MGLFELEQEIKRLHTKYCLHPSAGPNCHGKIANAHTLRRGADLSAIARAGKVYQPRLGAAVLKRGHGIPEVGLVGINTASTFTGFCEGHDDSTFAPLEKQDFVASQEQCFLLAYRAIAREMYLKEAHLRTFDLLATRGDAGRELEEQKRIQAELALFRQATNLGDVDTKRHKAAYDRELLKGDYSQIRYVAVRLDRTPDIVCAGGTQPDFSFDGELLQVIDGVNTEPLDFVTFSLITTKNGGAAVFAWRADSSKSVRVLLESFLRLSDSDKPNALVRFALESFENVFFRPGWWENLSGEARVAVLQHFCRGVSMPPDPRGLQDEGQWFVEWEVTDLIQRP